MKFMFTLIGVACLIATQGAYAAKTCFETQSDRCLDATPCKKINGINACLAGTRGAPEDAVMLATSCWQYQAAFTCTEADTIYSTCGPLREQGCGQIDTQCISRNESGTCMSSTLTYRCEVTPATKTAENVCSPQVGNFDTSSPPDADFGMAAAMMEAAREAGTYGVNGENIEVFKGYKEECSVKVLGGSNIKSCCDEAGGGQDFTNYEVLGVTAKAAYAAGKEEISAGSKYVYDALFQAQDASLVTDGASAAAGGLTSAAADGVASQAGTSFGAYGFQFSYSAAGGFQYVGFDPTTFAIAVAIKIITTWLACEQQEQVMQMKRGQNLCSYVDSYCSDKVLGVCVEKKEQHCCFNSVLAKLINRQGKAQLGLDLSNCGGFTQDQLTALDFSSMDLSEFIATIVPTNPSGAGLSESVTNSATQKITDYYGQ